MLLEGNDTCPTVRGWPGALEVFAHGVSTKMSITIKSDEAQYGCALGEVEWRPWG